MLLEDKDFIMQELSDLVHSYPYTSLKHVKYAIYIVLFVFIWRLLMKIDESFV